MIMIISTPNMGPGFAQLRCRALTTPIPDEPMAQPMADLVDQCPGGDDLPVSLLGYWNCGLVDVETVRNWKTRSLSFHTSKCFNAILHSARESGYPSLFAVEYIFKVFVGSVNAVTPFELQPCIISCS